MQRGILCPVFIKFCLAEQVSNSKKTNLPNALFVFIHWYIKIFHFFWICHNFGVLWRSEICHFHIDRGLFFWSDRTWGHRWPGFIRIISFIIMTSAGCHCAITKRGAKAKILYLIAVILDLAFYQSSQIFLESLELFFHTLWQTVLNLGPAWLADVCAAKT